MHNPLLPLQKPKPMTNPVSFKEGAEGVFHGLDSGVYHAANGVSNSMLKRLGRSPAHLKAYLEQREAQTPAMLFGQVVHQLLLEPDKPWFWAVRPPGLDGRSKEGKEWKAQIGD